MSSTLLDSLEGTCSFVLGIVRAPNRSTILEVRSDKRSKGLFEVLLHLYIDLRNIAKIHSAEGFEHVVL